MCLMKGMKTADWTERIQNHTDKVRNIQIKTRTKTKPYVLNLCHYGLDGIESRMLSIPV